MYYCRNCKINYQTPLKRCLFCNNELINTGTTGGKRNGKLLWEGVLWPEGIELRQGVHYPERTRTNHAFFIFRRILLFLLILTNTICLYINYITRNSKEILYGMGWSFLVLGVSLFILELFHIAGRNLMKRLKVIWYSIIIMALGFWIGICIGKYQWALDYLLPFGFIITEFYATVLLLGGKRKIFDAAIYVFWLSLLGLLPILFRNLGWLNTQWVSITCGFYSGFTLFGLFFWGRKEFLEELKRRFYF